MTQPLPSAARRRPLRCLGALLVAALAATTAPALATSPDPAATPRAAPSAAPRLAQSTTPRANRPRPDTSSPDRPKPPDGERPRPTVCIGGRRSGTSCICPSGAAAIRTGARVFVCRKPPARERPDCADGRMVRGHCRPQREPPATRTPPGRTSLPDAEPDANPDSRREPATRTPGTSSGAPRYPVLPPPSGPVRIAPGPPSVTPGPLLTAADQIVPDEVVGTLPASTPEAVEDAVAQRLGLVLVERRELALTGDRLVRYRIPDGRAVAAVVAALAADAALEGPQPNFVYVRQGGAQPAVPADLQYAHARIDLAAAHALARGRGALVGVLDSGVDLRHPDLAGAVAEEIDITAAPAATPSAAPAATPSAAPAATPSAAPAATLDPHGTAIAGIIAARGVVKGVAPLARVLSVRAFRPGHGGGPALSTTSLLSAGIDTAAARGAQILNMSFAGAADPLLHRLVRAAAGRNVLLVAAAGNNGPGAPPAYPAAYPEVIAVTATDAADRLYAKANHGGYIALAAPGVDVLTLGAARSHQLQSGTSFAAAHVSGILALMLERSPALTAAEARDALTAAVVDLGAPGRDTQFGAGRVDAAATLRALAPAEGRR